MFMHEVIQAYHAHPPYLLECEVYVRSLTFRGNDRTYGWVTSTEFSNPMTMWVFGRHYGRRMTLSILRWTDDNSMYYDIFRSHFDRDMTVLIRAMRRRYATLQRARMAFAMGGHGRLGAESLVQTLESSLIKLILTLH